MIDFHKQDLKHEYRNIDPDSRAVADRHVAKIREELAKGKESRFWLGVYLLDIWNDRSYRVVETYTGSENCTSERFFRFCMERLDLEKSYVSRLMNVVDEFGDALRGYRKEWAEYSWSVLAEMLPLTPEQRKNVTPKMSVRDVREYKKTLVATSQQEAEPAKKKPEEEFPQFKGWKKNDFCRRIVDLEEENRNLQNEIAEIREENDSVPEQLHVPTWISVSDDLPQDESMKLVYTVSKAGVGSVNRAYFDGSFWHGSGSMAGVTHWMELPDAPERSNILITKVPKENELTETDFEIIDQIVSSEQTA